MDAHGMQHALSKYGKVISQSALEMAIAEVYLWVNNVKASFAFSSMLEYCPALPVVQQQTQ
jgi:hypothetical protein